jgi:hypothetical protein
MPTFHSRRSGKDLRDHPLVRTTQMTDSDPILELLLEIQRIVHQPTPRKEPALHHFQRDFDAIRALCEKGVGKYRRPL